MEYEDKRKVKIVIDSFLKKKVPFKVVFDFFVDKESTELQEFIVFNLKDHLSFCLGCSIIDSAIMIINESFDKGATK